MSENPAPYVVKHRFGPVNRRGVALVYLREEPGEGLAEERSGEPSSVLVDKMVPCQAGEEDEGPQSGQPCAVQARELPGWLDLDLADAIDGGKAVPIAKRKPRAPFMRRGPGAPPAGGPPSLFKLALRVLMAASELRRRGAVIRSARLLPQPAIVIDEPPPGLLASYAFTYPADRRARAVQGCARATNGVPILWTPAAAARNAFALGRTSSPLARSR